MTPHDHTTLVPGCFRCELGRDEVDAAVIEFCGCETYPAGEECGMVVCWKCEQIVCHVDDEGAITTAWMQAEIERLRTAVQAIADDMVPASAADYRRVASGVREFAAVALKPKETQ